MDEVFEDFIRKMQLVGVCDRYSQRLSQAGSKKQFIDLALEVAAAPYFCRSVAKGWGLKADYIKEAFRPFLNGRYRRQNEGYTAAMYCGADEITASSTLTIIIGCHGTITADRICELHLVDSECNIIGIGRPKVYLYNSIVTNERSFRGVIKDNLNENEQ